MWVCQTAEPSMDADFASDTVTPSPRSLAVTDVAATALQIAERALCVLLLRLARTVTLLHADYFE